MKKRRRPASLSLITMIDTYSLTDKKYDGEQRKDLDDGNGRREESRGR